MPSQHDSAKPAEDSREVSFVREGGGNAQSVITGRAKGWAEGGRMATVTLGLAWAGVWE